MSNKAFDARLQRMTDFFVALGRPLLMWMIFFSAMRFLVWFSASNMFLEATTAQTALAFFTGARFDLLIIGFALIPVVLFGIAAASTGVGFELMPVLTKAWLAIFWWIAGLLAVTDWLFFAVQGRRLTVYDLFHGDLSFLSRGGNIVGNTTAVLVIMIFLCLLILGARQILQMKNPERVVTREEGLGARILRLGGPVLVVALMARGTIGAHHLEKAHSEISDNLHLNQLVLNPVWAFDKKPL